MKFENLDSFDLAILERLQISNRTPLHEIGRAVNLSAAAVQRRVRRMENAKIIQANVAVIDPRAVGRSITLIVEVQLSNEQADILDAVQLEFASTAQIQQCYYVTGAVDFILVITVASMEEYATLSHRLFLENKNVKRFSTYVAMSRIKASLSVPVRELS